LAFLHRRDGAALGGTGKKVANKLANAIQHPQKAQQNNPFLQSGGLPPI